MTDKKVADADQRQADREAVAAKGKERAETEPKVETKDEAKDEPTFVENPRYGVKVSGENDGR